MQHKENRKKKRQRVKENQAKQIMEDGGNITPEMLSETKYAFDTGLRRVVPYDYIFKVHAKQRWHGKPLLDLFTTEFSHLSRHVYEKKIQRGDITINGNKVERTDCIVGMHDFITHKVHRHEPPVALLPMKIITMNEEFVVVDKPASVPVHPCGRYRHNSVIFILAHEHQLTSLHGIHRLDRLTSGLLLLARSAKIAKKYGAQIASCSVHKQYIARVKGDFPSEEMTVDQPIKLVNPRQGLNSVSPDGKPCKTVFVRKSFDPATNTSIVLCKPLTGRTHQIRIHLQWLGHPIANDPLYNDDPSINKLKCYTSDASQYDDHGSGNEDEEVETSNEAAPNKETTEHKMENESDECPDCRKPMRDPTESELLLYLHAFSYEGPDWKFETELPGWAQCTQ